jgi:hypothetical protein
MIGASYQYYGSKQIFILKEIRGYIYYFECGHWCTDTVFHDLFQLTLL